MALNDFLKKAKETASNTMNNVKASMDQKKAEKEAYEAEMTQKAADRAQEIINTILSNSNSGSLFRGIPENEILSFTKEFYDKLLMPALSVALTKISMHPYIDEKEIEKIKKIIPDYDGSEAPILLLRVDSKQLILLTYNTLYFSLKLEEDNKYVVSGNVSVDEISDLIFETNDESAKVICDGYTLASFKTDKTIKEDFISLTNYFECIKKHDFEITDEEVDALIQEKIGSKIVSEIKKYMVYDDEQFVYFAWGLDSLAAKDYIVCTNKQIIVMDREAFGATSNIKQFYYEDITSASTEQNSESSSLTGYLLESAITAATKTCDLYFSVAGAKNKIKTLYKAEAERIVAVYHFYRKAAKTAASQPQVVVQQAAAPAGDDPMTQLKKLNELKELGIISEEEFNEKKAALLSKI